MNFVNRIILSFQIFLLSTCINAQRELFEQFHYAQSLYENENYFDAVTEFKRVLFFDDQKEFQYSANFYIADSYKSGGMFSEAIRYFTLAELASQTIDDVYICKVENIKLNILRRTTERANRLIDELLSDERFTNKTKELYYWKGWSYIFSDKWEEASNEFSKIKPDHELSSFSQAIYDSLYNVQFAKVLSYFIPGAGQFYTGEYLSGILSLGWNSLWGYLTINAFTEERIFDGFAVANLLWFRFYNGNVYNAEKFAIEKNKKITNRALEYLQFTYDGDKP
jgi:TM2 domain-containing membrane protein YozV